jgi:hypothetical protein
MSVESVLARVATLEQALANPAALMTLAARTGGTAAPTATSETAPTAGADTGESSFAQALASASGSYDSAPATTAASGATALANGAGTTTAAADPAGAGYPTTTPTGDAANGVGYPAAVAGAGAAGLAYPTSVTGAGSPGFAYPTSVAGSGVAGSIAPVSGMALASPGTGVGARIVAIAESQAGQTEQPPGSNESPAIAHYRTATAGALPGAPWCAYFASWAAREAGVPIGAHGEGLGAVGEIWSWAQSSGRAIPNGPGVTPRPGDLIVFGDEHVGIVKDVLPNGDIQTIEGNYENKVALNTRSPTEATGYVNME